MKFDKNRCLELLKKQKNLEKENKLLIDCNKIEYDELIAYIKMVNNHSHWLYCKKYTQLSIAFVLKYLSFDEFFRAFVNLRRSCDVIAGGWLQKLEEEAFDNCPKSNQINIQMQPQSSGFSDLMDYLFYLLDLSDPDGNLEDDLKYPESLAYGTSEKYLRLEIEDYFIPRFENYEKKF